MKFICDEMLAHLGKWLRAAGYDTIIVSGLKDEEISILAHKENRYLLTRDHDFLDKDHVIYLADSDIEAWVKELNRRFQLNWLFKPFSRCLECNTVLIPAEDTNFLYCPHCKKTYWEGSHTKDMHSKLQEYNSLH